MPEQAKKTLTATTEESNTPHKRNLVSKKLTRIEEQTGETFINEKSSKLPKIGKKHLKDNTKRSVDAKPDQSELNMTT